MNEDARLRWRCRRGMRELDQLLGWYFEHRYAEADEADRAAFRMLLDAQDPDLWDWMSGRAKPARADWCRIVDEIRGRNRI